MSRCADSPSTGYQVPRATTVRQTRPWARAAASRQAGEATLARFGASFCCWRSGLISTTFQASLVAFIARMTHAVGSTSHQRSPCIAERGKAWWLWCQDSPKDSGASQKTLVEWSSTSKRREPKKWQTELIDHVT